MPAPPRTIAAAGSPISQARVRGKFIVTSDSGWQARQHSHIPSAPPVGCTALEKKWLVLVGSFARPPLAGSPRVGARCASSPGGRCSGQPESQVSQRGGADSVSPEEFTDFYAASFRRLVGQLYAMTGDNAEAQDAVQEAFVRAWAHRGRLESAGSPDAWVRATAWRIAVSRWHRARIGRLLMRT